MGKKYAIILAITALIPATGLFGRTDILRECVDTLSGPSMQGRGRINSGDGFVAGANTGHDAAAEYIAARLSDYGLFPFNGSFTDSFPMYDSYPDGINAIALFPGMGSIPVDRYIIVGAHYDNLGTIKGRMYPGADANASGVAALLGVADTLSAMRSSHRYFRTSVILVAFDCNLDGREGARHLWRRICSNNLCDPATGRTITPESVVLMMDIDQVGSSFSPLREGIRDYLIAIGAESLPAYERPAIHRANRTTGLDIGESYYGSPKFSDFFYRRGDRGVFVEAGVPVLYFTSGITDLTNTVDDTAERIDFEVLKKRAEYICTLLCEFL